MPRFNHMELTLPQGALAERRSEIAAFYADLFGWESLDVPIVGQLGLLLRTDPETSQFILITEQRRHLSSPGYDHLGLLFESRGEVDALLEKAKKWQERDPRVEVKEYEHLRIGGTIVHPFYVRHLLPLLFDVQVIEYEPGAEPKRSWSFA